MARPDDMTARPFEGAGYRRAKQGGLLCSAATVVVAALIGSGMQMIDPVPASADPKPTPTVAGSPDYETGYIWFSQNLAEPYQSMDQALQTFAGGIGSGDINAVYAGCGQLSVAARMYQRALPGPSTRVNGRLQSMIDELSQAVVECQALQPGAGWEQSKPMMSHVNAARARLRSIQQTLQPYN